MPIPATQFAPEQINEACRQVVASNGLVRGAHIREVRECTIPRELLYIADEAFFTGTAAVPRVAAAG